MSTGKNELMESLNADEIYSIGKGIVDQLQVTWSKDVSAASIVGGPSKVIYTVDTAIASLMRLRGFLKMYQEGDNPRETDGVFGLVENCTKNDAIANMYPKDKIKYPY